MKSEREVAQSCPTLSDPMDCSLSGSSIHGISQARVMEWVPSNNFNSLQIALILLSDLTLSSRPQFYSLELCCHLLPGVVLLPVLLYAKHGVPLHHSY